MTSKQTVIVVDFPTETVTPVFIKFVKLKKNRNTTSTPFQSKIMNFVLDKKLAVQYYTWIL